GEACLLGHIDGIIEDHDTSVPEEAFLSGQCLVIERRIEQRFRKIRAQRSADLYRAKGPAGEGAAAEIVDRLAESQPERFFHQAAVFDIAGKLDGQGAAR